MSIQASEYRVYCCVAGAAALSSVDSGLAASDC
jgi:hypothetical protein